jgi:hypothetical protein
MVWKRSESAFHQHTAPDIHPNKAWHDLISEVCREPDDTSFSGMDIRHDTHLAVLKRFLLQERVYLFQCLTLDVIRKNLQIHPSSSYTKSNFSTFSIPT